MKSAFITGTGRCVPQRRVTNEEIVGMMNTTVEFITSRTGIRERRHAPPTATCSDLMVEAASQAMRCAGVGPDVIDMLIVNTLSPDYHDPAQACLLQKKLGLTRAFAFDIRGQCSGFLYGLDIARQYIATGQRSQILVVCGEMLSKRMDCSDDGRNLSILLGDGAGASVVSAQPRGLRVRDLIAYSDGNFFDLLWTKAPGTANEKFLNKIDVDEGRHFFRMNGKPMFEHAVSKLVEGANEILQRHQLTIDDLDVIVPHQPNLRILEAVMDQLRVKKEKCVITFDQFGNSASAALPIALDIANEQERFRTGGLGLLLTYGSGATWAAALVEKI